MILSYKRITKALIRLCGCKVWSAPLLSAHPKDRFSRSPYCSAQKQEILWCIGVKTIIALYHGLVCSMLLWNFLIILTYFEIEKSIRRITVWRHVAWTVIQRDIFFYPALTQISRGVFFLLTTAILFWNTCISFHRFLNLRNATLLSSYPVTVKPSGMQCPGLL